MGKKAGTTGKNALSYIFFLLLDSELCSCAIIFVYCRLLLFFLNEFLKRKNCKKEYFSHFLLIIYTYRLCKCVKRLGSGSKQDKFQDPDQNKMYLDSQHLRNIMSKGGRGIIRFEVKYRPLPPIPYKNRKNLNHWKLVNN